MFLLDRVSRVQGRLLRDFGLTELNSILRYRVTPFSFLKYIFMYGVLHKLVFGFALPQLAPFFPLLGALPEPFRQTFGLKLGAATLQAIGYALCFHFFRHAAAVVFWDCPMLQPGLSKRGARTISERFPTRFTRYTERACLMCSRFRHNGKIVR